MEVLSSRACCCAARAVEGWSQGKKLEARFEMFFSGQWKLLIDDSTDVSSQAASARIRKRRRQNNNSQVARAENLTMIGELSAARQALESNGLAAHSS